MAFHVLVLSPMAFHVLVLVIHGLSCVISGHPWPFMCWFWSSMAFHVLVLVIHGLSCVSSMVKSIGSTWFVHYIVGGHSSEGPLLEVPPYWLRSKLQSSDHFYVGLYSDALLGRTLTDLLMLATFTASEADHGGACQGGWCFSSTNNGSLISHQLSLPGLLSLELCKNLQFTNEPVSYPQNTHTFLLASNCCCIL